MMKLSTIINEMSNSIIAYHGSTKKIDNFVDDFVGGEKAIDQNGPGIYFTTSIEDAQKYGDYIYKVQLEPRKLVSTTKTASISEIKYLILNADDWEEDILNWDENPNIGLSKSINAILKYKKNQNNQFQQVWIDFYRYSPVKYVRNVVKLGYDATRFKINDEIDHIVVLNPQIIKIIK